MENERRASDSAHSHKVWRSPRSRDYKYGDKGDTPNSRISGHRESSYRSVSDSQRTITEVRDEQRRHATTAVQPSGRLVYHKEETEGERIRRIKGKAPMVDVSNPNDGPPHNGLNSLMKGQTSNWKPVSQNRLMKEPRHSPGDHTSSGNPKERSPRDTTSLPQDRKDQSPFQEEREPTEEEFARMEKELEQPVMEETMIDNDDLLGEDMINNSKRKDLRGQDMDVDEERIEAISQLSPETSVREDENIRVVQHSPSTTVNKTASTATKHGPTQKKRATTRP